MGDVMDHDQVELVVSVQEPERSVAVLLPQKPYHPAALSYHEFRSYIRATAGSSQPLATMTVPGPVTFPPAPGFLRGRRCRDFGRPRVIGNVADSY
jgi:hypothetical protein